MKPTLLAVVFLALGVALGWVGTRNEFARDVLPMNPTLAVNPQAPARSGPRAVVVNGERHNFGTMDRFAKGEHVFRIRNDGTGSLELALGHTTCKCTIGDLSSSRLAPGEATDVKLQWQVKTGETVFEQSAEIITNDPHHNPIRLVIHGTVIDTLRPEEPQFTLNDVSTSQASEARLAIYAFRVPDLQVKSHRWLKPDYADHLQVSILPLDPARPRPPGVMSGVTVVLKVLPGMPIGPFAQSLEVTFNVPEYDPLEIPLFGTVSSDVSLAGPGASPSRLLVNLGQARAGEGLKRTAYIVVKGVHRDATEVKIARLEPAGEFQASVGEPLRDNPAIIRFPVTFEVPPTTIPVARIGEENFARVHLAISHPQVKEMIVKVRYIVTE